MKEGNFKNKRKRNFGNTELVPKKEASKSLTRSSYDIKHKSSNILDSNFSNI